MIHGFKREVVAKLRLPMPINEGLNEVTHGLEKIYGICYCGGDSQELRSLHEDGWWIIWREVPIKPQ